jgi:hypothetical protein
MIQNPLEWIPVEAASPDPRMRTSGRLPLRGIPL